jgi:hypothetical protein
VAGTVTGGFKAGTGVTDEVLAGVLTALLLVWVAVAWIDFWYYGQLLRGAVRELKRIESSSRRLRLSTQIEAACKYPWRVNGGEETFSGTLRTSNVGRGGFYAFPTLALFGGIFFLLTPVTCCC